MEKKEDGLLFTINENDVEKHLPISTRIENLWTEVDKLRRNKSPRMWMIIEHYPKNYPKKISRKALDKKSDREFHENPAVKSIDNIKSLCLEIGERLQNEA